MAKKISQSKSVQKLSSQIQSKKNPKSDKREKVTNSSRANLNFPVGKLTRLLR